MTLLLGISYVTSAADVIGTDGETIGSGGLINLGRKLNKPMLTLIGMAIRNLHECSQWSTWTQCDAERIGHFGSRERTRECYHDKNKADENDTMSVGIKLDYDHELCEGRCRAGFNLTANGNCLKLIKLTKSYDEAERLCEQEGGSVIRIDSQGKYDDAMDMLVDYSSRIFIGGKRHNSDWDYLPSDFIPWHSGEPSGRTDENCLYLHEDDRLLADIECNNTYAHLCEVREWPH